MHAVIKTGGKQYRVKKDDIIVVEKLEGDAGSTLSFDQVLMISGKTTEIGAPTVEGVSVAGEVVEQAKGEKVIIFKKRRRKNSRRRNGHRQLLTKVRITDITKGGKSLVAA